MPHLGVALPWKLPASNGSESTGLCSAKRPGEFVSDDQDGFDEQVAIDSFLASPDGLRLAGATTALDRAAALNNWLNTHSVPDKRDLRNAASTVALADEPDILLSSLTQPLGMTLVDALHVRRSGYEYSDQPLSLGALGSLLRHAVGFGRRVAAYGRTDYPLSVAPSGGGLNSVVTHLAVRHVERVPSGIYRYEPVSHALVTIAPGNPTEALREVYLQSDFATAPVSILLAGRLRRVLAKYPLRHYRVLHIDAGIAIQNLYLTSTAIGLSCCAVTGYRDQAVKELLRLDEGEIPTVLFAVGHSPMNDTK